MQFAGLSFLRAHTASGKPYTQRNVLRTFKRVLKKAKLPSHFNLKSLRHTYASQRLAAGESIYYVQRQLGHSTIKLTVDTYDRWLPARSVTRPGAQVVTRRCLKR